MDRPIPIFMTEKREIARFLCFVLFWTIIFSLIYHPNVTIRGVDMEENQYVLYLAVMISSGFIFLIISRIMFYHLNKHRKLVFKHLCLWIVQEMVLISLALSIVSLCIIEPNSRPYWTTILPRTAISVTSLLIIPNVICWLYFSLEDRNRQIKELKEKKQAPNSGVINFHDEKGVFRLSVRAEDLLYIQSADNYVFIHYLNSKQELSKFMLRNTLKYIEETFSEKTLVRCHRFFVVNMQKVRVMKKGKEGLTLELDTIEPTEIPVSKTFAAKLAEIFAS